MEQNTLMEQSALTAQDIETFAQFAQRCILCPTEAQFAHLVRTSVRALLPHGSLIAVIGQIDLGMRRRPNKLPANSNKYAKVA